MVVTLNRFSMGGLLLGLAESRLGMIVGALRQN